MTTLIDSAMARAKEMVGRLWEISTELTHDGRVVGLRTARLNDVLVVMRPAGEPVYARVMELSESSQARATVMASQKKRKRCVCSPDDPCPKRS